MVVHAVAVLGESGKILVWRPYVDMTRYEIERCMGEFLHLLKQGQENNHVETEHKYYLYLPIESMYVVIVTDKDNITAYMETVKLLHKLVSESSPLNEEGVCKSAIELIFAFDEVIRPMGHTFDVDIDQVMTNLQMCSENELSSNLKTQMKVAKEIDNKKNVEVVVPKDDRDIDALVSYINEPGSKKKKKKKGQKRKSQKQTSPKETVNSVPDDPDPDPAWEAAWEEDTVRQVEYLTQVCAAAPVQERRLIPYGTPLHSLGHEETDNLPSSEESDEDIFLTTTRMP